MGGAAHVLAFHERWEMPAGLAGEAGSGDNSKAARTEEEDAENHHVHHETHCGPGPREAIWIRGRRRGKQFGCAMPWRAHLRRHRKCNGGAWGQWDADADGRGQYAAHHRGTQGNGAADITAIAKGRSNRGRGAGGPAHLNDYLPPPATAQLFFTGKTLGTPSMLFTAVSASDFKTGRVTWPKRVTLSPST